MYMTARMMHAKPGHFFELAEAAIGIVADLNANHGSSYAVSGQVGGNPAVVGAASAFETMGDYEAFVTSMEADADLMARASGVGQLLAGSEDVIVRMLAAPGDRSGFTAVASARMHMPRVTEAIPFALEVSELAEAKTGVKIGVGHATTGDRSQIFWMSRHDTLADLAANGEALDADPEFMELYKRSAGLMVDGSLEQQIWRVLG